MAFWSSMAERSGQQLPGHGMLPPVARGTPGPKVLLARSLLSQLTDSLLRSRRGASVFSIPGGNREPFADICEPNSGLTVRVWKSSFLSLRKIGSGLPKGTKGIDHIPDIPFLLEFVPLTLTHQRKRPGGAIDSRPARKRSRLLPSSAGGTSQTEPRDLEESATAAFEPEVIDLTGEDTIDLTGEEEVIDLTGEDVGEEEVIDLTGEDVVDLTGEEVIDLTGEEEVIDLRGEDVVDLTGEEVIDLTGEDVIDLTGEEEVIDLTGEDVIDLTGEEVIDLTGEDVVDLTGEEEVIDLTGEDVIDLTGEDVIDLTGEEVIDLTGEEEVIDLTGEDVIDLTGEEVIDLTGEEVIDLTGEDVVDLTGESSEPEVIIISDDESPMDREQSQQQLHLSRASAEPLARDDEEEPRDIDGSALSSDWLLFDFDLPYWSDEDSEVRIHMSLSFLVFGRERDKRGAAQLSCFRWDGEQNQQHPHVSSASGNSADLLASDDEEEPREVDGAWPAGPASPLAEENEDSEDWEPPHFFRTAENSAELPARDTEEEPRDNQGWPDGVYVALLPVYYYPGWWYLQQQLHFVRAVLAMGNNEEEQRDNDDAWPAGPASPLAEENEDSEDWEPPHFFRTAENSAELPARDTEEEPRDNQGRWPDGVYVALLPVYYYPGWWYLQQQLHFVRAVLAMGNNEEEQRDNDEAQPAGPASPPASEDEVSECMDRKGEMLH
ncbi:uncharacterized protein LOC128806829 [Vidua macroura]|uniref:uncharacterized protein LOC128806829 n=1 Tax=Vidua macroura TaxID=187451 RepID=UPI0023A87B22|nr:uncharacterized protein LOC128806829 [Vidua macroura]